MSDKQIGDATKIKVGVIGVGNAGGQVAVRAAKDGHSILLINTSSKDLGTNIIPKGTPSIVLGDKRGCGKNRGIGKNFLKAALQNLFNTAEFVNIVKPADVIVVVASTAGGTGSGMAPLLVNRIEAVYPTKKVIFYGILPKLSESLKAHANTNECLDEVTKINVPYLIADLATYEDEVNDVAYANIANHITETLNVLRGDYTFESRFGMIDERDLITILSEPGYMAIYSMTVDQHALDTAGIQALLISHIKSSPAAKIQRDTIVKEMGIMVNMPEELVEKTKTGNYAELTTFLGVPLDIFENYSTTTESKGKVCLMVSGLSVPFDRLEQGNEIIRKHQEALSRVKTFNLTTDKSLTAGKNLDKIMSSDKDNNESTADVSSNIPEIL